MTTTTVQAVVAAAQQLSPTEQLEVIQALTRLLQQHYLQPISRDGGGNDASLLFPATVRRTAPLTDLRAFAADFWPEDESADDINAYIARQHTADRSHDMPDWDDDRHELRGGRTNQTCAPTTAVFACGSMVLFDLVHEHVAL